MTVEVDFATYSDADCTVVQSVNPAPGTNPLHMQVRSGAGDPTAWVELTTANGLITVSGSNVTLFIPQSALLKMPAGQYVYSVIMSSIGGTRRTELFRGVINHSIGPTQWDAGTP